MDKIIKASCELLTSMRDEMNYTNLLHYATSKKHWEVVFYRTPDGDKLLKQLSTNRDLLAFSREVRGFSHKTANVYYIFLDSRLDELERLRVLAHEIGHITLGHLETDCIDTKNKTQNEIEANKFAECVLRPKKSNIVRYRLFNTKLGVGLSTAACVLILISLFACLYYNPINAFGSVYVLPSGTKYHTADCMHLNDDAIKIPISKARERYAPCSICKPQK